MLKKFFTTLIILFIASIFLFGQKTIELGKQWNVVDYKVFTPNTCTDLYSFRSETIINSVQYLELYHKSDTINSSEWQSTNTYMREDSMNRVFVLDNNEEKLLYDFNLSVNDTININYNFFDCELSVINIDSIQLLNGEWRKRIRLIRADDPNPLQPWYGYKDWIQGIGSATSLTSYIESCYTDYPFDLLCYFENEELIYANPNSQSCFITPVNEIEPYLDISLFPNPTRNTLNLKSEIEQLETSVYSLFGKLVLTSRTKKIDVTILDPGIYIIRVKSKFGETAKKIIVE